MSEQIIDAYEITQNNEAGEDTPSEKMDAAKALAITINETGTVDIHRICRLTGLDTQQVTKSLRGAVFQRPEPYFDPNTPYDPAENWVIADAYLSGGNIKEKLRNAEILDETYPGRFQPNIDALRKILPDSVAIEDIHIVPGQTCIPTQEIENFIMDFFNLHTPPTVIYNEETSKYKIEGTYELTNSHLNNVVYGVPSDDPLVRSRAYFTGIELLEDSMNARTVKACDTRYLPNKRTHEYEPVSVINKAKTVEAQNKLAQILEGFSDWVMSDPRRIKRFEEYYNEEYVGYTYPRFDGSFLTLPGLNPAVQLYEHQRNDVARAIFGDKKLVFAGGVGTGKTYELIVTAYELHRMGLSKNTLVVVPKHILQDFENAHRYLYPDDTFLVVKPRDFSPAKRAATLKKMSSGKYTAVYISASSFDMIPMSRNYYANKLRNEIIEIKQTMQTVENIVIKGMLESALKRLGKKLDKLNEKPFSWKWKCYDDLNIDTLMVDEAHTYKNISIKSSSDNIIGLSCKGSEKSDSMLEKVHTTDRVIFATGTPITNSIADVFTLQTYLQPEMLAFHKIKSLDNWINTFGQRENSIECDVDANSTKLRSTTRFSSFNNLTELMSMFSQICSFFFPEEGNAELPRYKGPIDVLVPKSKALAEYINQLTARVEAIRAKQVDRTEDNLLKVTTDGRLAALDLRLVLGANAPASDCKTKVEACADKIYELYCKYPDSAQIVFSDIGTPKFRFNIYDELANQLVKRGVNKSEIAYVHDATNEAARNQLFSKINTGEIRVVIGSTQKLGVGVNIQEKLVALHHLSVPWKPADMVQREGRILRKGNTSEEIFIFRYITEGSFDAYSWQILENKQKFISSFLSGTSGAREVDDISNTVLSYAEVKALAIGNPIIKKRVEVSNMLEKAKISNRSRQSQLRNQSSFIDSSYTKIRDLKGLIEKMNSDYRFYCKRKKPVSIEERTRFGVNLHSALRYNSNIPYNTIFRTYQGFTVIIPARVSEEKPYILIKRKGGGEYRCELRDIKSDLGYSKAIDYVLEHLNEKAKGLYSQILSIKKQMGEARLDIENGNPFTAEVERLQKELEKIDREIELIA